MNRPMHCRDAIEIFAELLDQTLAAGVLEQLERHVRNCQPCRTYLNTYGKTRKLVGSAGRVEMPDEVKSRLRHFLLAHL
jgi:hypothetical protein